MAVFLKPDKVKYWNGLTVNEYFITNHNPNRISLPVKRRGEYIGITLHNTNRITVSPETTPAEQYTRATVNGNMNSVRVHFYVDDRCAWQNLPLDYSSWHAGQKGKADERNGSEKGNGNTISIECIMSGNGDTADIKARDNAARLIAYLREHYGGELYTHNYWCNVRNGKKGTIDELNKLNDGYKGCPIYIRPSWDKFKTLVDGYMPVRKGDNSLFYVQVGAFKSESLARNYLNEVKRVYPSAFVKADGLYYVQVGAFRSKSNAEAFLLTVKEQYPSAFIKVM